MSFEWLSRYAPDQPLTPEEEQLLDTSDSVPGLTRCLQQLPADDVRIERGPRGQRYLRYGRVAAMRIQQLMRDHLVALAERLYGDERFGDALGLASLNFRLTRHCLGPSHAQTLGSMGHVAECLRSLGREAEALPVFAEAIGALDRVLGPDHVETVSSVHNMARCLAALGEHAQALPLFRRAHESLEHGLGHEHPHTLVAMASLAECLEALEQVDAALPMRERALFAALRSDGIEHPRTLWSGMALARCVQRHAPTAAVLAVCERALPVLERGLGPEHPATLACTTRLAECLRGQDRAGDALPLMRRAVEAYEKALGRTHPTVVKCRSDLAGCLLSSGDAEAALPLFEQALAILEGELGPAHESTLTTSNNVAACLYALDRAAEAAPIFDRARQRCEQQFGPEHAATLTLLSNQAGCLLVTGHPIDALPLLERVLGGRERVLGPEHVDTLMSVTQLASCLSSLGRAAELPPHLTRMLSACERELGPDDHRTIAAVIVLADALQAIGRSQEAVPLFQRVLATQERVLGEGHEETVTSANRLAVCLDDLGRAADALPLYERAYAACRESPTEGEPARLAIRHNLAGCLLSLGRVPEAVALLESALASSERRLGTADRGTVMLMTELGHALRCAGRAAEALATQERAYATQLRVAGPDDLLTLTCGSNLSVCLAAAGRQAEALEMADRIHASRMRVLGTEHRDTLKSLSIRAACLGHLGRPLDALRLLEQAIEVRTRVLGPGHPDTLRSLVSQALVYQASAVGRPSAQDLLAARCWMDLAARLLMQPQPGGAWTEALEVTIQCIASHAKAGLIADWETTVHELSAALQQVIDLQTAEQLAASRSSVVRFFDVYLGLCVDLGRLELIPQVLAARQGRKLAALALDELEHAALDPNSLAGRFQFVRVELRRLALGLRTSDDDRDASFDRLADRALLTGAAANERQRAQSDAYAAKLREYRALREELASADSGFVAPVRALEVTLRQLQSRLDEGEALLLLFERHEPSSRLALLVGDESAGLVPLADQALAQAGALSEQWSHTLHARSGMRRGVLPSSELAPFAGDAGAELPALQRLGALLDRGLWDPLAPHLGGIRRLHVVTHGSFHLLPLTCIAPAGLAVCAYPGLVTYHRLWHRQAMAVDSTAAGGRLGMAVHAAHDVPGLSPIPFVMAEAQIVRALWPGEVHADPQLARAEPALAALQLAGHGRSDPADPSRAGLLMAEGALDLHAVLAARQHPTVVVLSACTVGRSADDPDGEPLGLVGGFMLKGARVVIASLQPVPDFYMPLLMALFHRCWRDGSPPAEALAEAKQRLALGHWHADTEALVRRAYQGVLVDTLAHAQKTPGDETGLLLLTHAWLFPPELRELQPGDGERLNALRSLVATPAGRERLAERVLQTLTHERSRLPRRHLETLCTWVVAFGTPR